VFISQFNLDRIRKCIGESLWQNGLQVVKPSPMKLCTQLPNPFSKALSSQSTTISTASKLPDGLADDSSD